MKFRIRVPRAGDDRSKLMLDFNRFTVELSWPSINISKDSKGIWLHTCIGYKYNSTKESQWKFLRAGFIKILGFGIGLVYNHCENPDYIYPGETKPYEFKDNLKRVVFEIEFPKRESK